MNFPRSPLLFAVLLATLAGLQGCGDAQSTQTPEELAERVVASFKANDFEAFRAVYVSREDMLAMVRAHMKNEQERKQMEDAMEERSDESYERRVRSIFSVTEQTIDWKSVEVVRTIPGPVVESADLPPRINTIVVELSGNRKLEISGNLKWQGRWIIVDPIPLKLLDADGKRLRARRPKTQPVQPPANSPNGP